MNLKQRLERLEAGRAAESGACVCNPPFTILRLAPLAEDAGDRCPICGGLPHVTVIIERIITAPGAEAET